MVKTIDDEARARSMSRSGFLAYAARKAMQAGQGWLE